MHIDRFLFCLFSLQGPQNLQYLFNQIFDNFRKDDGKFLFLKIHFYFFMFCHLKMFLSIPHITIFYLFLYI